MSPQTASKLESFGETTVPRELTFPREPGLVERLTRAVQEYFAGAKEYFHARWHRRRPSEALFVWDVPPKRVTAVRPETVFCVQLPASNPVRTLQAYVQAGVAPDHVVFVGDPLTLSDEAYYGITRQGALVHETSKKDRREQAQKDLAAFYEPPGARVSARPSVNPNPYSYTPGPPKVTPEQLQALVDAIGRRRR
jgi:hypothetical protein